MDHKVNVEANPTNPVRANRDDEVASERALDQSK